MINKKDGGFAWKDSYVFVVDFQGRTVANPLFPDHVGRNQMGLANKDGRMIIQEFIEIAKTKGEGWSEYMWPKPAEMQKPKDQRVSSKKASYVLRVPGQDMFVVAGVFDTGETRGDSSPASAPCLTGPPANIRLFYFLIGISRDDRRTVPASTVRRMRAPPVSCSRIVSPTPCGCA